MCIQADYFIGTRGSTFTGRIAEERCVLCHGVALVTMIAVTSPVNPSKQLSMHCVHRQKKMVAWDSIAKRFNDGYPSQSHSWRRSESHTPTCDDIVEEMSSKYSVVL